MEAVGGSCVGFKHLIARGTVIGGPYVREPVRRPSDLVVEEEWEEVSQDMGKPKRGVFVALVPLTSDPSPRVLQDILLHAQPIPRTWTNNSPCTSDHIERWLGQSHKKRISITKNELMATGIGWGLRGRIEKNTPKLRVWLVEGYDYSVYLLLRIYAEHIPRRRWQ
jgi:hypothetical protein